MICIFGILAVCFISFQYILKGNFQLFRVVVVLQTTAGWRMAPALALRVCTRGLADLRSISLKNTMNTAGFRVVRAAGA